MIGQSKFKYYQVWVSPAFPQTKLRLWRTYYHEQLAMAEAKYVTSVMKYAVAVYDAKRDKILYRRYCTGYDDIGTYDVNCLLRTG